MTTLPPGIPFSQDAPVNSVKRTAAAAPVDRVSNFAMEAFGIDHVPIRRLTESDELFRTGGRLSKRRKENQKKRGGDASKE